MEMIIEMGDHLTPYRGFSRLKQMKRTRKKLKRPVPIGNRLDTVLASIRCYADRDLVRVWDLWAATVGEQRAAHTRPAVFKDRLLVVYTDSSTWIHELRFQKNDIMARLNAALEKEMIDDIRFRIGPIDQSTDTEKRIFGKSGFSDE
jgi:predicted nucleic acid-binding Zn ribbon protein